MTPRQLSAKPGKDRRHLLPLCHNADDNERAPREGSHAEARQGCGDISFTI
jgi:hypothetical protein